MITVANIANASSEKLLCLTYELLLTSLKEAEGSEGEAYEKSIQKAIDIVQMLVGDLDFSQQIAHELFRIYVYVQGLLVSVKMFQKKEKLKEAYELLERLYDGFMQAEGELEQVGKSKPSIQNAQAVYAGMTYGKNDLNEMSFVDRSRGFKA